MITLLSRDGTGRTYVDESVSLRGMGDFGFSLSSALSDVGGAFKSVAGTVGKLAVAPLIIPTELGYQAVRGALHEAAPLAQDALRVASAARIGSRALLQSLPGAAAGGTLPASLVPPSSTNWPLIIAGVGGVGLVAFLLLRKPRQAERE